MKRSTRLLAIVIPLLAALALAFHFWPRMRGGSVPPRAGRILHAQIATPHFAQVDPRWQEDSLGGSGQPLRKFGCTLMCVTMALNAAGQPTDPPALNAWLKANNGYTSSGLIIWAAVEKRSGRRVAIINRPTAEQIDRQIELGNPVIAKVFIHRTVQHWVLIVGKDGDEYLMRDPLTLEDRIEPLSKYGAGVYAIRYLNLDK